MWWNNSVMHSGKIKKIFVSIVLVMAIFLVSCTQTISESEDSNVKIVEVPKYERVPVTISDEMEFAEYSAIKTGTAYLYKQRERKVILGKFAPVVAINAGHGTDIDPSIKTLSHPDGSPKVTGGTTKEGEVYSYAISKGMTFPNGVKEAEVTLLLALYLRDELLDMGYDVLMLREDVDTKLDNIARTVLANNFANIHISLHYDSTDTDKGIFYCSTPSSKKYRKMYPVNQTYELNDLLGDTIVAALASQGEKIYGAGKLPMDLTQMSYTKIPSIDLELGDRASVHTPDRLKELASRLATAIYCIPLESFPPID